MAESFTSYTVDNDRRFRNAINRTIEATSDLRVPFGQILSDFYKSEQSIFKLKGPGLYPPISDKYGKWKEKKYGSKYPLLVASGRLATSLLGRNNPGSISAIGPTQLIVGTSVKEGYFHQSDEPRKKIPLRKFLFIGPESSRYDTDDTKGRLYRWLDILNDWILAKARKELNGGL